MEARRGVGGVVLAVLALGAAYGVWRAYFRGDEAIVRDRLEALVAELNEGAAGGLGLVGRAAKIGSFFTEDIVVDVGEGGEPIRGREAVMGTAARLQPRTALLTVAIHDVDVTIGEGGTAGVDLTATLTKHEESASESSIDAREFELEMRKVDGDWLIARVTAIASLNK
jgi:hypothetical protein